MKHPLMAAALLCVLALPATAATLQMTVNNADGKPAPDTVVLVQPTATWTPQPLPPTAVIEQREIRFTPFVTVVPVGGSVRFTNLDSYDHHVRSQPGGPLGSVAPAKEFEFRLPPRRKGNHVSPDLVLDTAGTIVIGCHLHNSMRGHILVSSTPWYAVTDDKGQVTIDGLPEGQVDIRLWHPDQVVEQPGQKLQMAASATAVGRLNFTPRRRPPPKPKGEYDF